MTAALSDPASVIVEAFQKVLGLDDVPLMANFFRLGGTSLDMVKVIALLKRRGLNVTARQFAANPTATGVVQAVTPVPIDD
jgi:aryl carrier-like protein